MPKLVSAPRSPRAAAGRVRRPSLVHEHRPQPGQRAALAREVAVELARQVRVDRGDGRRDRRERTGRRRGRTGSRTAGRRPSPWPPSTACRPRPGAPRPSLSSPTSAPRASSLRRAVRPARARTPSPGGTARRPGLRRSRRARPPRSRGRRPPACRGPARRSAPRRPRSAWAAPVERGRRRASWRRGCRRCSRVLRNFRCGGRRPRSTGRGDLPGVGGGRRCGLRTRLNGPLPIGERRSRGDRGDGHRRRSARGGSAVGVQPVW